jgi:general stress protein 26
VSAVHSNPGELAKLRALVQEIKIGLLTTISHDGTFHTRPVETLEIDSEGTLWFFTDWSSPKAGEIEDDVRVSLGYANPANHTYVAISGTGKLSRDPERAKQLWTIDQRAYYPEGPMDPRLAVLRVDIEHAEYWIAPGRLSYLVAAARAAATGKPVGIIGEDHKVV